LAAKADFAFGPQQKATFFLTNTAPQWVGFNNGSWLDLEIDVRKFAEKSDRDFIIYTGTHVGYCLAIF
jgi:DNA/RNA endonuclease G (NUC1)